MNKITLTIISFLVATGLLLSACGASPTPKATLAGTNWALVSYGQVDKQISATSGSPTLLTFDSQGRVEGNLGCNGFSGTYKEQGGKLVFGPLVTTMKGCAKPQSSQEGVAFSVLTGSVDYKMDGSTLTIYDISGTNALILSSSAQP